MWVEPGGDGAPCPALDERPESGRRPCSGGLRERQAIAHTRPARRAASRGQSRDRRRGRCSRDGARRAPHALLLDQRRRVGSVADAGLEPPARAKGSPKAGKVNAHNDLLAARQPCLATLTGGSADAAAVVLEARLRAAPRERRAATTDDTGEVARAGGPILARRHEALADVRGCRGGARHFAPHFTPHFAPRWHFARRPPPRLRRRRRWSRIVARAHG